MELQKILDECGVTQVELAARMGVIKQHVNAWCRGVRTPGLKSRKAIAKALNIPLAKLLDEEGIFTNLMAKITTLTPEGALKVSDYIDDLSEKYRR